MPTQTKKLVGKALRNHLIKNICKIMREYAPEVGVTKAELANDIAAIKDWDLDSIADWFFIFDALGVHGNLDDECLAFYRYAAARWHYDALSRD